MHTALVLALVALMIFDAWSTVKVLENGGRERNAVVRWLIERVGLKRALWGSHAIFIAFIVVVPIEAWAIAVLVALYAAVAMNNYRVMRKEGLL